MVETLIDRCPRVETERLVLRKWEMRDLDGLIKLNTDPRVLEFFRKRPNAEESEEALKRAIQRQDENGFCLPVVEDKETGDFLGFCGLNVPSYGELLPCEPCVEIGWQLIPEAWGRGIAVEAAKFWLGFGFDTLGLDEVVAFTVIQNQNSRRVMEKLDMSFDPAENFDFPGVPVEHPLCRHVLYKLSKKMYLERENG